MARVVGERERERMMERERVRVRPLEDAGLVGEEAAGRARREREEREGREVLVVEDRRWDWLLGMCMCFLLSGGLDGGDGRGGWGRGKKDEEERWAGRRGDMLTWCSTDE